MKKATDGQSDTPSTIHQLAAAMAALGKYTGENSDAEHAAEAKRLGGADAYRMRLANALLGIAEAEAMLADGMGVPAEQLGAAHRQALVSAGAEDDPSKLLGFLRWRALRVEGPLREMAQNAEAGPIPLAAAHAAEGLQLLLAVCAAGQDLENASPESMTVDLKAAREALTYAVANMDIMLGLIEEAEAFLSQ